TEAMRLWAEAKTAKAGELPRWTEAVAAARRARDVLDSGDGNEDLRHQVEQVLRALETAIDQAQRDRDMVIEVEDVRLRRADVKGAHFDTDRADRDYLAAFLRYGLEIDRLPADRVVATIRKSVIRDTLVAALDDWAWATNDAGRKERLVALAR